MSILYVSALFAGAGGQGLSCRHGQGREEGQGQLLQGASHPRLHRPLAQAHAEDLLQEACPSSRTGGSPVCQQGDDDQGCSHRHQAQQIPVEQRHPQRPSPCPRQALAKTQRGRGCEGEDVHPGPTRSCGKLQGAADRECQG